MTDVRTWLDQIDARTAAATPGPWKVSEDEDSIVAVERPATTYTRHEDEERLFDIVKRADDGSFVVGARTDQPILTDALRAVLDLHTPRACTSNPWDAVQQRCDEDDQPFPCPTVTAINTARENA